MEGIRGHAWAVLLGCSVLSPTLVQSVAYVAQCTCYDNFWNFYAKANDVYKDALADRLSKERPDSRAALRQIQTEMLRNRDPIINADLASKSAFTCQVWAG